MSTWDNLQELLQHDQFAEEQKQSLDKFQLFRGRQFYCWQDKEDDCFNHLIGLPVKNGVTMPLFEYEKEVYDILQKYKYLWVKKATGLGITEFILRYMAWLALDQKYQQYPCQFCIVTGPNEELAIILIQRFKDLFRNYTTFDTDKKTIRIGNVTINAYPSNHLDAMRSLKNPKFIFLDEADFFRIGEQQNARDVSERYIGKSDPYIIMVSTPNVPGGLFETIEEETESLYHRLYFPYTVGLNKIYSLEEIEKVRASPSFEREYNLRYGYGLGNVFLPTEIDAACAIKYNPAAINHACDISLGIDPGGGSSKTAFCVLMLEDGILKVLYAKEFERPSINAMLDLAVELRGTYKPQRTYVDANNPQFIRDLKIQIHERADFENVIAKARHDKIDYEYRMKVVPISFNEWGRELVGKAKMIMSKGWLAVSPTEHKELVTQMRMARVKENGNLDKEETANSTYDVFDSFRLGLKMFNMPRA